MINVQVGAILIQTNLVVVVIEKPVARDREVRFGFDLDPLPDTSYTILCCTLGKSLPEGMHGHTDVPVA